MDRLLVVDGSNLLFQMFYGMPARIVGKNGRAIQGTLGFVGALLKIIRRINPTHVAVLFDGEYVSERREEDPEYKANRPDFTQMPEEETPFSQLPDIQAALDLLDIRWRETTVCEADDWIAGYAQTAGPHTEVVIMSQDSDFFQLITPHVRVLRYRGDNSVLCDEAYIREKLGISPCRYAAYKSLTGDTADNIRGADKIGPKTAAALMEQFGDLDTLFARTETVAKPSVRRSLQENEARIRKNYRLIALSGGEVPFSTEELVWRDPGLTTTQILQALGLR